MTTHHINGMTIETHHEFPPIALRAFDWTACLANYDGADDAGWQPVGVGQTEREAIADLLQLIEDHEWVES